MSGKRLCRLMEIKGWELKRINGSNLRISVPVHGDTALKIGLQKQMMKMVNIDESEL